MESAISSAIEQNCNTLTNVPALAVRLARGKYSILTPFTLQYLNLDVYVRNSGMSLSLTYPLLLVDPLEPHIIEHPPLPAAYAKRPEELITFELIMLVLEVLILLLLKNLLRLNRSVLFLLYLLRITILK